MADLDLTGKTIVVVDDESFSRQIVVDMLHGLGRPVVYQAKNGKDAIGTIRQLRSVDIVISDYKMPVQNGLQLLKMVRTGEAKVGRAMLFAMLTGYGQKELVELALALDVNAFLVKRVSKAALRDRLIALLRSAEDQTWLKPPNDYQAVVVDFRRSLKRRRQSLDTATDTAMDTGTSAQDGVKTLSVLKTKFANSDLKTAIDGSAKRLAASVGRTDADRIMAVLNALEQHEKMTVFDIAAVLSTEDDSQETSLPRLQNKIDTVTGSALFRAGMPLSRLNKALVLQLDQIGDCILSRP
jgi:two-component system chemotaxis response regulator CheY